eukprot:COSAG04_NODE_452_length_14117_cov_2.295834_6_plen_69_part_00
MGGSVDDPALINTSLLNNHAARDGLDPIRRQLLCGEGNALVDWVAEHGLAQRPPFQWTVESDESGPRL